MTGGLRLAAALLFCLAGLTPPAAPAAEERPLWEIGAGATALSFPAYRGSNQTSYYLLPMPLFAYRGDFFKADRHGIRGSLFDTDRVEFTVSLGLSPPARSDDIVARTGMPDLDPTFEIGPQVDLLLWRSENRARSLKFQVPLRAAFTLDSPPRGIGWVYQGRLNLDVTDLPGMPGWSLGLLAGPLFGDRRQNAYFYSVEPQYATPTRPAYQAAGGYAGVQFLAALSKRFPGYWVGSFLRYDNLSGATFADSPLVLQKNYFAAGIALAWILGESSTRVPADD
jgi:outer membrane scaffolding protein for murein synthesis (MipA/OmpV family)